jgi:hypothetical protein
VTQELATARATLHRVAAHVLGRRRHAVTGRFGLRASPGGFATPAFGEPVEVVRVAGTVLVHETTEGCAYAPIAGWSLRRLAAFVGADIDAAFSVGADTPGPGDVDAPLTLDAAACDVLAGWFALGCRAMDAVVASLPAEAAPAVVQLWPEHFDAGTNVGTAGGQRCNVGVSPGDDAVDEPYAYLGPWGDARPGDGAYWNAPFGAVLRRAEVQRAGDPLDVVTSFFREGLRRLGPA